LPAARNFDFCRIRRILESAAKASLNPSRGRQSGNTAGRGFRLSRAVGLALRITASVAPLLGAGGHKIWSFRRSRCCCLGFGQFGQSVELRGED
jgi:hypothetical protein